MKHDARRSNRVALGVMILAVPLAGCFGGSCDPGGLEELVAIEDPWRDGEMERVLRDAMLDGGD